MERPFKCPECDKAYTRNEHLKVHMRIHAAERPYICEECGLAFMYNHVLKTHMRTHTGERPFKCTECDATYKTSGNLFIHTKTHTGEKSHKCTECDAAFTVSENLKTHMRVHTGERPYKCTVCDAEFTQRGSLAGHMKIHTGEKMFKCEICEFECIHKHTLTNHIMIHTGVRPYKCAECDYSSSIKFNVKDHFKRIHSPEAILRQKKEEAKVEKLFNAKYPQSFVREYRIDHSCLGQPRSHSRVDFLFPNHGKFHVVVEVDEHQHKENSQICETSRINNIVASWCLGGNSVPVVFIRYNPHAFKVDGTTKRTTMVERHKKLTELLDRIKTMEPSQDVHVFYMFYDTEEEVPTVMADPDYYDQVKSWFVECIV